MGKVIMSGIVPQVVAPVTGTPLGDLSVGSVIKLNENGTPVDYLIVNQGIPSNSSLYDSSCNGTWLLRKNIYAIRAWHSSAVNDYKNSDIHAWMNGSFLNLLDSNIQNAIQVKIPYVNGTGGSAVASGSDGMATKIFLLSCYEVGFTTSMNNSIPVDGACLSYFSGMSQYDNRRIAYLNGGAKNWWLRSAVNGSTKHPFMVASGDGSPSSQFANTGDNSGARPALILPSTARLQDDGTIKV